MLVNVYSDKNDETAIEANRRTRIGVRPFFEAGEHNELVIEVMGGGQFEVSVRSKTSSDAYEDRRIVSGSLSGCWIYGDDGHTPIYV